MIISGLQKMTLLDYPGKVACTVFLHGCNYRCPFCHNSPLLTGCAEKLMTMEELFAFLKKRRGLLDAVCVSGGEPTLQPELPALLQGIKDLGFLAKLDTNGTRPDALKALCQSGLVDYVAMDVKNSPARYAETAGLQAADLAAIEESLRFLLSGKTDYELRTTVVSELHDAQSIEAMGRWLASLAAPARPRAHYIQPFADRESVLAPGLHTPSEPELTQYVEILRSFAQYTALRGA